MTDLGSIYGTDVDGSNTLVIDFSNVDICGNLNISNHLSVLGDVSLNNNVDISNHLTVFGDVSLNNNVDITGNFRVNGNIIDSDDIVSNNDISWLTINTWPTNTGTGSYYNYTNPERFTAGGHMGRDTYIRSGYLGSEATQIELFPTSMVLNALDWALPNRTTSINLNCDQVQVRGALWYTSDNRLKHNEIIINNGLELIRQLEPQFYQKTKKILDENYNGDLSGIKWYYEAGLIAQDILKIKDLSYCVIENYIDNSNNYIDDSNNYIDKIYSVNYNDIFVYNIVATKELDSIVKEQKNEINDLKNENTLLKNALNTLLSEAGKPTI